MTAEQLSPRENAVKEVIDRWGPLAHQAIWLLANSVRK